MSDRIGGTSEEALRALCQEAIALARSLPGPLRRIAVRSTDNTVEVEWPISDAAQPLAPVSQPLISVPDQTPAADIDAAVHVVRAPLVGTFYRAPQRDADPFVAVGDVVEVGQTVAIVETMKLLNHIVTEVAGRIVEICLSDGESVEFEQPLMCILPPADDHVA